MKGPKRGPYVTSIPAGSGPPAPNLDPAITVAVDPVAQWCWVRDLNNNSADQWGNGVYVQAPYELPKTYNEALVRHAPHLAEPHLLE